MPTVVLFTIGTYAVTVGTVVQIALVIASVAYSRQQSKKMKKALKRLGDTSAEARDRSFTAKDPAGPRRTVYGECRVGGNIVFIHTNGLDNQYIHVVMIIASHEVEAISNLQLNDESVTLDSNGAATGKYAGYLNAKFFYGQPDQIANASLIANCPEVWTSDHRLRGLAGVYIRLKYSADLFPNGIPNYTVLCKGKKVYDPRTDLTVWTDNAALCLADYLTDTKLGMGFDYDSEINEPELIASANNCDELITLEDSSTEKRYTVNGAISADTVHQDVVDDMVEAMAGKCTFVSGKWLVISGYYRTPTFSFDENHLRGSLSVQTKVSRSENFNAAKGTFISPDNFWQSSDFPPITNSTYQTQDGNVRIFHDFSFPFTTSSATCQRLAKIALEKVRQPITVKWPGKISCLRAQCGDVVNLNVSRFGWVNKPFEVVDLEVVNDGESGIGVDITFRETASGVYDWNDGEETTFDLAPNTNLPDPFAIQPPTGIVVTSDNTTTETVGDESIARMLVEWTSPADAVVVSGGYIRIQYKPFDATSWRDWGLHEGSKTSEYIYPVITGLVYVARLRSENRGLGIVSNWVYSDPTAATGDTTDPAAPTGFTAAGGIGGASLAWTNPTDTDFSHIEIYEYTANTPDPTGGSTALASAADGASTYFRSGLSPGDTRYYWIRSTDTSGNKSAWVGPRGATAFADMSVSLSPSSVHGEGYNADPCTTSSVSVSVSGGIGPFSFTWVRVSYSPDWTSTYGSYLIHEGVGGDTAYWTNNFSLGISGINTYETWKCIVTDYTGNNAETNEVVVNIYIYPEPDVDD